MEFKKAPDIKERVNAILQRIKFPNIDRERIICFRSHGSTSRARARIWSFPRIWQLALNLKAYYVIEVLAEKFDKLNEDDKTRVIIHELLHIPKTFSGALLPHRGRGFRIDYQRVETLFKEYKKTRI